MKKMVAKYFCFLFFACGVLVLAGCATSPPKEAPPPGTSAAATPAEKRILKNVYFDFDKSELTPQSRAALEKIAAYLHGRPGLKVLIEGHCDERGTEEYNLALGEKRALSARRYLVGLGVGSKRIQTISYGEERPLDSGHGEDAWSKNRRAEFKSLR